MQRSDSDRQQWRNDVYRPEPREDWNMRQRMPYGANDPLFWEPFPEDVDGTSKDCSKSGTTNQGTHIAILILLIGGLAFLFFEMVRIPPFDRVNLAPLGWGALVVLVFVLGFAVGKLIMAMHSLYK